MRLIDADELKKRAIKVCFADVPDCGEFDAVGVFDIDIMPTIDPESLRPEAEWISVKDRPPEPETEVFIYAEVRRDNKILGHVVTTAIYEDGTIHTEESIWNWDDINYWGTYCEETDDYIIPEGWWEERHYNDDDTRNLQVDDFVTHWMPLPKPPEVNADD